MAQLMRVGGPLKVEIRLQQALDGFIQDLASDQKNAFLDDQAAYSKRLPDSNDVMTFMGQLNSKASRSNFGPRAQSILQVTQQFAAIGDVLIGGSQNLIACGVWTVVRFTLQAAVSSRKLIDKISEIFMTAGRSTPRYEALARLYDHKSTKLRTYYYEYFHTLVNLCHYLFKFLDKSLVSRAVSSLSDTECNAFQSQLSEWSAQIKDETIFMMAQGIEEQRSLLDNFRTLSKVDNARKLAKARAQILDACSTYPYESSWKRFRKKGNTKLFQQIGDYFSWQSGASAGEPSSTLVLLGGLGSGKSVLAANIIEDLGSMARSSKIPILYFFCEYGNTQSIDSRVILGSLARQVLQSIDFTPPQDISKYNFPLGHVDGITELLEDVVPRGQNAYCIIDGLYECDEDSATEIFEALSLLQKSLKLHLCLTFRLEATTKTTLQESQLENLNIVDIPDNSDDVENFIGDELERCIEHDLLKLGDPTLVEEILTTLTNEAQGMFLWAELQISALCWTSSDKDIRKALHSLPKTLAETFQRLLERAASHGLAGHENQRRILAHMVAAARPLTKDEIGDLLGVTPFELIWTPDQTCTNVDNMLATCGSLITVDEDDLSMHFVHSSAKKFLLERDGDDAISYETSNTELAELVMTYLNYNIFQTELARFTKPNDGNVFQAASTPAKVIQSSIPSGTVKSLSLRLLRAKKYKSSSSKGSAIDLDHVVNGDRNTKDVNKNANRVGHPFYGYAMEFWAHHAATNNKVSEEYSELLRKTIPKHVNKDKHASEISRLRDWAGKHAPDILILIMDWFIDVPSLADVVLKWMTVRLDLSDGYLRALRERPTGVVYTLPPVKLNDHLEQFSCIAAMKGETDALDFFLYRAHQNGSLSHDLLAKYTMLAIYGDQGNAAEHMVFGQYSKLFDNIDRSNRVTSLKPLSESEPHLRRLGLWAALFANEQCYRLETSWTVDPPEWLITVRRQLKDVTPYKEWFNDNIYLDNSWLRFTSSGEAEVGDVMRAAVKVLTMDVKTLKRTVLIDDKDNSIEW